MGVSVKVVLRMASAASSSAPEDEKFIINEEVKLRTRLL